MNHILYEYDDVYTINLPMVYYVFGFLYTINSGCQKRNETKQRDRTIILHASNTLI